MSASAVAFDRRRISRFALFVHRSRAVPYLLLLPCAAWIVIFFIVPLVLMIGQSLTHEGFSTVVYTELMTSPQYFKVMITSLKIVTLTTIITLLIGYPIAYALTISGAWNSDCDPHAGDNPLLGRRDRPKLFLADSVGR